MKLSSELSPYLLLYSLTARFHTEAKLNLIIETAKQRYHLT